MMPDTRSHFDLPLINQGDVMLSSRSLLRPALATFLFLLTRMTLRSKP